MRVAALIATETVSGPGRQLAALAQELAIHGVDLRVLILQRNVGRVPPYADYLAAAGVSWELIPDRGPLDVSLPGAVRSRLREMDAALLQTHGYKATAIGFALQRNGTRWPWIGFFHGSTDKGLKDRAYQWLERRMLLAADTVAVVARSQAPVFAAGRNVRVVHNAVLALPAARRAAAPPLALPPSGEAPRIAVIGRLSHEKGVDIFLRSCSELQRRGVRYQALIVGDGPEEASLRRLSANLGIADAVSFLGHVDDMTALYPHLDLVVLPSRTEGLPNVLLEALAADVPVVATRVGAVADVLHLPGSGVMVPPQDPAGLADGIAATLAQGLQPEWRDARRRVLERFSLSSRAELHLEMYRDLTRSATREPWTH